MKTNKQIRLLMEKKGTELYEKAKHMDRITITEDDFESCFRGYALEKLDGLNGTPILKEGVFVQKTKNFSDHLIFQVQEFFDDGYKMNCRTFQVFPKGESQELVLWAYDYDARVVNGKEINIEFHNFSDAFTEVYLRQKREVLAEQHKKEFVERYTQNVWSMFKVMAWINYLSEHPEVKEVERKTDSVEHSAKQTKKKTISEEKKSREIRINGIRVISSNEKLIKKLKSKSRQRLTECWGVRGHYRHYSNGKKVYIHPYMKGKKDGNVVQKQYSLSISNPSQSVL